MEKRLMDREVLCILDTRQIQRFMFRSNTMTDTIGASDLIKHILDDAIAYALDHVDPPVPRDKADLSIDPDADIPYLHDPDMLFQLVNCTAGNALFIARTGELAQKIIRKASRYYLENAHALDLTAVAVERTDVMGHDIFELYRKLNAVKASSETLEPLGCLPVCKHEHNTGQPIVGFDEELGDPVSASSVLRRREARLRDKLFRLQDIATTLGHDGKRYRAVLHADGNNMGITIGRFAQNATDYETGIRMRRALNKNIKSTVERVMGQTLQDLAAYYEHITGSSEGFDRQFQIIHVGGDDINCVCNATMAFPFLRFFYANLEGAVMLKSGSVEVPLYMCAGVAFVTEDCAYHPAFTLAEECCSNAKKIAKKEENLVGGLAANWIDFQVLDNPKSQNLEMLRERSYTTSEKMSAGITFVSQKLNEGASLVLEKGHERSKADATGFAAILPEISLLERPYFVGPGGNGEERTTLSLIRRVCALKELRLSSADEMALRQSYRAGVLEFLVFVARMRVKGIDLIELLGEPLWEDGDGFHATWFDAVDVSDFVPIEAAELLMSELGGDDRENH